MPSFSNTEYLYNRIPSRYRRDDKDLLLKRFLSFFGDTLDEYDEAYDSFSENIDPATATEQWIRFWLRVLFDWSWFPWWFTLADMRRVYGNFARHLARKGTRPGIEAWLRDFGIVAKVHTRSKPWGEFVWGETTFAFKTPLHFIIEILSVVGAQQEMQVTGEMAYGEGFYVSPRAVITETEIINLVRFVRPQAQEVTIVWSRMDQRQSQGIVFGQRGW